MQKALCLQLGIFMGIDETVRRRTRVSEIGQAEAIRRDVSGPASNRVSLVVLEHALAGTYIELRQRVQLVR